MNLPGVVIVSTVIAVAASAMAEKAVYECDVEHSARLDGIHLEGAGVIAKIGTKEDYGRVFALEISSPGPVARCDGACKMQQTVREVPSSRPHGAGPDLCESGGNQVLMYSYSAIGAPGEFTTDFHAAKDLGFLRLIGPFDEGKSFIFWQSGFDYPGCVDTRLVIRKGTCKRRD